MKLKSVVVFVICCLLLQLIKEYFPRRIGEVKLKLSLQTSASMKIYPNSAGCFEILYLTHFSKICNFPCF